MPLEAAPTGDPLIIGGGTTSRSWWRFFTSIQKILGGQPMQVPTFIKTNLPVPVNFIGFIIYVPDATGGAIIAYSDGTNWRRTDNMAVIS